MAKDTKLENPIIFYLYDAEGNLNKRTTKISSPYNKIIKNSETRFLPVIQEELFVVFEGGIYKCESQQESEWLRLYTNRGGEIEINGKKFKIKGNMFNTVKEEAPRSKVETIDREVRIEIQKIPKLTAELMLPDQLKHLCLQWNVPVGQDTVKAEDYIKLLEESDRLY